MSIENTTPEKRVAENEIVPESPEVASVENVEISKEELLEHATRAEKQIKEQATGVLLDAEQKIANSAKSMNVSPETLEEMKYGQGIDSQLHELNIASEVLADRAKREVRNITGVWTMHEDGVMRNEKGQVAATKEEEDLATYYENAALDKEIREGRGPWSRLLEHEQGIAEFKDMVASFEVTYPLVELFAIVDLTDAGPDFNHPLRDPAKEALKPIFAKLNALKKGTTISGKEYEELEKKWKVLSNAVGMVNKGMVDHTR